MEIVCEAEPGITSRLYVAKANGVTGSGVTLSQACDKLYDHLIYNGEDHPDTIKAKFNIIENL